jgi:superfamily I DNA/RNA helicase
MIQRHFDITDDNIDELGSSLGLDFSDLPRRNLLKSIQSIDVQACPGSGKTTLVAAKLILLSKSWPFRHRGICALSHTNVAKDEIIASLARSGVLAAQSLLRYPHFIGTIQEFVNRYLALPSLRSAGHSHIVVDNDQYADAGLMLLSQQNYFANRIRGSFGDETMQRSFLSRTYLTVGDAGLVANPSALPAVWSQQANYQRALTDLNRFKQRIANKNIFLYRDMYSQAHVALQQTRALSRTISKRFPMLFLDEMQDTQKFQDELLRDAFGIGAEGGSIVQRFGDPDQAIFHGVDGEEPNESFNEKMRDEMDHVLDGSHRYGGDIAEMVRPFSLNEIALTTALSEETLQGRTQVHSQGLGFSHTVFVFDDNTRSRVVREFCNLVSGQFAPDHLADPRFAAKVVGAVGADIDPAQNQLRIGHYWPEFQKSKSASKANFDTLVETIRFAKSLPSKNLNLPYRTLRDGVLKLLELANERDADGRKIRASTLKTYLSDQQRWDSLRALLFEFLNSSVADSEAQWAIQRQRLLDVLALQQLGDAAQAFLRFAEPAAGQFPDPVANEAEFVHLEDNAFIFDGSFKVELSTIHGIKGETHDATLILETKNRAHDIGGMLQHFTGERPDPEHTNRALREKPHHTAGNAASKQFLRQLYVAMSRPKFLLCFAVHRDRLSDDERTALLQRGWVVSNVFE